MASVVESNGAFSVRAHVGDAKTLLAFNIDKSGAKDLAGFTVYCQPKIGDGYYLLNDLQFERPGDHAQDPALPANSSINAPYHKFRWLHVPGSAHQGIEPYLGAYTYTVTPRYFSANGTLQPLDKNLAASVVVDVIPFKKGDLALGFTRGFTQSQAFDHHFGKDALIVPDTADLIYDTSQMAGTNASGTKYSFLDEYEWSGFTARKQIFELLNQVLSDKTLRLDVFAYDLNEPDLITILLKLAAQGRVRIMLDDAPLHLTKPGQKTKSGKPKPPTPEDQFTKAFKKAAAKGAEIQRGHFQRYSHDKVFIVSNQSGAVRVLTGSTNFSVTGMYVNSNHVLVVDDEQVASAYSQMFEEVWGDHANKKLFLESDYSKKAYTFSSANTPKMEITFSPHAKDYALAILKGIASRIENEGKKAKQEGSVLFAVMQLDGSDSTVYKALASVHQDERIFSYGISDTASGIKLYKRGSKQGVLVTGKPTSTILPPPFDQVRNIGGFGHQVHHKFVVCGFNGFDPVVYCGSSNLASGGEQANGDNLLAIHDPDVATAFAIEAVALVDHFDFLDRYATKAAKSGKGAKSRAPKRKKPSSKAQAAMSAEWYLDTDDKWTDSYFDPKDIHFSDRQLFAE